MTRKQVHDLMENELRCVQRGNYCDRDCAKCPLVKDDKELIEAYGYVIKALEQETVSKEVYDHEYFLRKEFEMKIARLEQTFAKIRAEIDVARFIDKDTKLCKNANASGLEVAMQIIDKYKNEYQRDILPKYEAKVITRGNCMMCGKELTEGLFFCKECEAKAIQGRK